MHAAGRPKPPYTVPNESPILSCTRATFSTGKKTLAQVISLSRTRRDKCTERTLVVVLQCFKPTPTPNLGNRVSIPFSIWQVKMHPDFPAGDALFYKRHPRAYHTFEPTSNHLLCIVYLGMSHGRSCHLKNFRTRCSLRLCCFRLAKAIGATAITFACFGPLHCLLPPLLLACGAVHDRPAPAIPCLDVRSVSQELMQALNRSVHIETHWL